MLLAVEELTKSEPSGKGQFIENTARELLPPKEAGFVYMLVALLFVCCPYNGLTVVKGRICRVAALCWKLVV